jgi:cytochrome P450
MSPPSPGSMWREVQEGGIFIDGHKISSDFEVGVCIYAIHHNPIYFPDPFKFLPERWLPDSDFNTEQARSAFNPFSIGPRSCIGKGLAYQEMSLAVARIIWLAEFRVPEGNARHVGGGNPKAEYGRHRIDEFQMLDQFTTETDGPMLEFRRRKDV